MTDDLNSLDIILALIKEMETMLLTLKKVRGLVGEGKNKQMVESLIREGEAKLAEIKQKVIQ